MCRTSPKLAMMLTCIIAGEMNVRTSKADDPAKAPQKVDLFGDPLPPGAVARMGTMRLPHSSGVRSIAISPDGKTLASGHYDKTIRLWDLFTGREIRQLTGHRKGVITLAYSPDGKSLASGSGDITIRLWDVATGKEIRQLEGHESGVFSVAYSPDGNTLASGSHDKTIRLWNVLRGTEIKQLLGHQDTVCSVAFSQDGKSLASGSHDKTIRLWNMTTDKEVGQLSGSQEHVCSVAYCPDGTSLASGSIDKTISLWDKARGKEIRQLSGHQQSVWSVVYSPDGKILASGSDDKTIRLWETLTGKEIRQLNEHQELVFSVAFSPDGKTLASGSLDSTILIWDVSRLMRGDRLQAEERSLQDLKSLWTDLAGEDAAKAYRAIHLLLAAPGQSLSFLQEHLQPVSPIDPKSLQVLIADLDSNDFSIREKANRSLEDVGGMAESALRKTLASKPESLELRKRIEYLLENPRKAIPPPAQLQSLRAVQVLEHLATPEAQAVLKKLAQGAEGARLTQEAKVSLERLARQSSVKP